MLNYTDEQLELEKVAIANALQLQATRRHTSPYYAIQGHRELIPSSMTLNGVIALILCFIH